MKKLKRTAEETAHWRDSAIESLRKHLPHGSTVHTVVIKRSRNGVSLLVMVIALVDGQISNISSPVSDAIGREWDNGGIWTNSEFDVVQKLSYVLHGEQSKGRNVDKLLTRQSTPKRFHAGYTLEHRRL